MLPAKYRLKKQFLPLVLKQNKAFSAEHLTLRLHRRSSEEANYGLATNWAVVISNKVAPLSVDRHLIKRRIHAILEKSLAQYPDNLDIIIQVKTSPLDLNFVELETELTTLLRETQIIK